MSAHAIAVGALAYSLTRIVRPDLGFEFSTPARATACGVLPFDARPSWPPRNIAMTQDGNEVAFVEHRKPPSCGEDHLVTVSRDGRRSSIPRPDSVHSRDAAHSYWVASLGFLPDRRLIATVTDIYSGAVMGQNERSYVRVGTRWAPLTNPFGKLHNEVIDAVSVDGVIAVNTNLENSSDGVDFLEARDNRAIGAPKTDLLDLVRHSTLQLGLGAATGVCGRFTAGFLSTVYFNNGQVDAVLWNGKQKTTLGRGVAYDVGKDGIVVGDNRRFISGVGQPTFWSHGKSQVVVADPGSAVAIQGNLLAGQRGNAAFIASIVNGKIAQFRLFKNGFRDEVSSEAFRIASNGDVLVGVAARDGREFLAIYERKLTER